MTDEELEEMEAYLDRQYTKDLDSYLKNYDLQISEDDAAVSAKYTAENIYEDIKNIVMEHGGESTNALLESLKYANQDQVGLDAFEYIERSLGTGLPEPLFEALDEYRTEMMDNIIQELERLEERNREYVADNFEWDESAARQEYL
ncbi:MAG: hypothetical protein QXZ57_06965, partial [Nitrososphaerota archaeon]